MNEFEISAGPPDCLSDPKGWRQWMNDREMEACAHKAPPEKQGASKISSGVTVSGDPNPGGSNFAVNMALGAAFAVAIGII